jgi:hypothetical protein
MNYLLHVSTIYPDENMREISSTMDTHICNSLDECVKIVIDYFDDLPVDELPPTYNEFCSEYIRHIMDSPPIRFTIFDINNKCMINSIGIVDIYNRFIDKILLEEEVETITETVEKNMTI